MLKKLIKTFSKCDRREGSQSGVGGKRPLEFPQKRADCKHCSCSCDSDLLRLTGVLQRSLMMAKQAMEMPLMLKNIPQSGLRLQTAESCVACQAKDMFSTRVI